MTQVESSAAHAFFDGLSKAMMADLVVDFVRRNAGDEELDGMALVDAVISEAEPIVTVREDGRSVASARAEALKSVEMGGGESSIHNGDSAACVQ